MAQSTAPGFSPKDTRAVLLLDKVQNDNGFVQLLTELDGGFEVGDKVYVIGGPLDKWAVLTSGEESDIASLYATPTLAAPYTITAVDFLQNRVTIDLVYEAGMRTANTVYAGENDEGVLERHIQAVLCRSAFVRGTFRQGTFREGAFGRPEHVQPVAVFGGNDPRQPLARWEQGVFAMGEMRRGRFASRTDGSAQYYMTRKLTQLGAQVTISYPGYNNGNVGYNKWLRGEWGTRAISPVGRNKNGSDGAIWENGEFLGGTWHGGAFLSGAMRSDRGRAVWAKGLWSAGKAYGVDWRDGEWEGGEWHGAPLPVLGLSWHAGTSVLRIRVDTKHAACFSTGDMLFLTGVRDQAGVPLISQAVGPLYVPALGNVVTANEGSNYCTVEMSGFGSNPLANAATVDLQHARLGFTRFRKGKWRNGSFYGGIFGMDRAAVSPPVSASTAWGKAIWYNGLFEAGVWVDGVWYDGYMRNSLVTGRSKWYDGLWWNGTAAGVDFTGGCWYTGTASDISMAPANGTKVFWVSGTLTSGTVTGVDWLNVTWRNGNWLGMPRPTANPPGTVYQLASNNVQRTPFSTLGTTGVQAMAEVSSDGTLTLDVVGSRVDVSTVIALAEGDIITLGMATMQTPPRLIGSGLVQHKLSASDVTKITAHNDETSASTLLRMTVPYSGLPPTASTAVRVITQLGRRVPPPADYVTDFSLELVLKKAVPAGGDTLTYYPAGTTVENSSGSGSYELYLKVTPANPGATLTLANALTVQTLTYAHGAIGSPQRVTTSGQTAPGVTSWPTTSGGVQYIRLRSGAGTAGTPISVLAGQGAGVSVNGTVVVRPYSGFTTTVNVQGTWRTEYEQAIIILDN